MRSRILVTGGAGFIGSALCRHLGNSAERIVNVDKLTYAGNLQSVQALEGKPQYRHCHIDILDAAAMLEVMRDEAVEAVVHLAAESHVDRSIEGPAVFIETNIIGTFQMLKASLTYWRELDSERRNLFRFHHVSTDEVFGDLPFDRSLFTETTRYAPSSPYSASKASSDHLVRAWGETYGLPVVLSNCSNNYGPFHFPEKLIPLVILNALHEVALPVYGAGANVRDWLFVDDHVKALECVMQSGRPGESYNIGGRAERTNLEVVHSICRLLDERRPRKGGAPHADLIRFVTDRPGHDRRYAIDPTKVESELGWHAAETFESGLAKTVDWYLANEWWWRPIRDRRYAGKRLGA